MSLIPRSNWIIKDILLVGEYPSKYEPKVIEENMYKMVELGVDVFINLMEPIERYGSFPYEAFLCDESFDTFEEGYYHVKNSKKHNKDFTFINIPIVDHRTLSDEEALKVIDKIYEYIKAGKTIFIHCRKGKGRTGTITCLLLCKYYGYSAEEALKLFYTSYMDRVPKPRMKPRLKYRQELQVKKLDKFFKVENNNI